MATEAPTQPRFASPESYTPKHLAEKILTSKAALEGERKQVTVLFADVKGSMELLADRDPEEARKILDPVLERMMEAVHRYEGTVNQVMGDGIMALFGAPVAHEDHAIRACYAALRMQESVKRYAERVRRHQGVPVQIRVGLNSGEVVVRAIGSDLHMDYTVGQTTHLAARMEQLAEAGTVVLTSATLALSEDFVQVTSLGPMGVRGLRDAVEVYELVGANPARSRFQAHAARGLATFVGRTSEIARLAEALDRARTGRGQVVAVVGEPGVGKSRLSWEFARSHRVDGCLVLEAASVSYGKAATYLPIIGLLRMYFQIEPGDDARKIQEKVIGQVLSLDRALEPAVPALLALLDVPVADETWTRLDPPQRRQRTMEGIKRLLLRESQVQPLIVIFEDLHWIDGETQAVLEGLVESLPTARMVLLVNYRPEYRHSWGGKTYYGQLRIDPLPAASADELLHHLLGGDPSLDPLKRFLVERTDGNPLFLEENVRTLVETHVLAGGRGAHRLAKPLENIQIPATVQAVLAARIDRLPPEEKGLLQTAAVIGKDVPFVLLQATAGLEEDALRRGLAHLGGVEFLYETRLFPDVEYTFKHALTYEVAYASLLQTRRRELHARILEAIEQHRDDRLAEHGERLAYHAVRAEAWEKAITCLRQAGDKAMLRSAYRAAAEYFEQALDALRHLPERPDTLEQAIDLRFALRSAVLPSRELERIRGYLHDAEALAETLNDPRRLAQILIFQAVDCNYRGMYDEAMAACERALALATVSQDAGLGMLANVYVAIDHYFQGAYRQTIECSRRAVALEEARRYERFGVFLPAVLSRGFLAWSCAEMGTFDEGRTWAEEGLHVAESAAHPASIMYAAWGLGLFCLRQGDLPEALGQLERAMGISQDAVLPAFFPRLAAALGEAYALCRRLADALTLLTQAMAQTSAREGEMVGFQTMLHLSMGKVELLAGHLDEAGALAERALALAHGHRERGHHAHAMHLLGDIAARRGPRESEQAEAHYRQALGQAEELAMRPLQAHCHLGLGKLYRRTGTREQAQEHLTTAVRMYREMDMPFWLEKADAELQPRS